MKCEIWKIKQLYEPIIRYIVPIYQRHYVWGVKGQLEQLWDDIQQHAVDHLHNRNGAFSHYMGAVVLEKEDTNPREVNRFQIVDGQQRLLTFQMFLKAAFDYAARQNDENFNGSAKIISNKYLFNPDNYIYSGHDERFKIWPSTANRDIFIDIIDSDRDFIKKKYHRYFHRTEDRFHEHLAHATPSLLFSYGWLYERLKHFIETNENVAEFSSIDKFDAVWETCLEKFSVVQITLDDNEDPQMIFETLNHKAEPLLASDLVRNNIYRRTRAESPADAANLFDRHWQNFENKWWEVKDTSGNRKRARIESFLSSFISGQTASEVNQLRLFSEYKEYLSTPNGPRYARVEEELVELKECGKIYREFLDDESKTNLHNFCAESKPFDIVTAYPLIMQLWRKKDLESQEKEKFLDVLLSYIIRRCVCRLTSKNYGRLFIHAISYLNKVGWNHERFSAFLLGQKSESTIFPSDEQFRHCWLEEPSQKNMGSARTLFILLKIESSKWTNRHEFAQLINGLTVEHILPQNWREYWPLSNGCRPTQDQVESAKKTYDEKDEILGPIVRRNRLAQTFGNLTILTRPGNAGGNNKDFDYKKEFVLGESRLVLNKEIVAHHIWDEDKIIERGQSLFEVARNIWNLPDIT